jgi:hypothetical protein
MDLFENTNRVELLVSYIDELVELRVRHWHEGATSATGVAIDKCKRRIERLLMSHDKAGTP